MKRSGIKRTKPLRARTRRSPATPARLAWGEPTSGNCQCGCDRWALWLEAHHVLTRNRLRQEGRLDVEWDTRNRMYLHKDCHTRHTDAVRRVPISSIPQQAIDFCREILGDGPAGIYLARTYWGDTDQVMLGWCP